VENGVLLCSFHHHEVHRRDLDIRREPRHPDAAADQRLSSAYTFRSRDGAVVAGGGTLGGGETLAGGETLGGGGPRWGGGGDVPCGDDEVLDPGGGTPMSVAAVRV
jgi:hypothetical protein